MIRTPITRSPDSSGDNSNASTQRANPTHLDDHRDQALHTVT